MIELLQRARAFDQRRPLWWDVGLPVLVMVVSLSATARLDDATIGALALMHGVLAGRRRWPFIVLLAGSSLLLVTTALAFLMGAAPPWGFLAVWIMLFNLGLREASRSPMWAGAVTVGTAGIALVAPFTDSVDIPQRVPFALAVLAMATASYLLGLQIHSRREQVQAQQTEAARAAVVAERSRIAQEMHDIIGHNLSVITSLATGGAAAVHSHPEQADKVFRAIGDTSRSSARDVKRVLNILRQDHSAEGSELTPQPGISELEELVESFRAAGLRTSLQQAGPLKDLSAGRQLAVYRIVQESLTNTLRHAGSRASSRISISYEQGLLMVIVDDDGANIPGSLLRTGTEPGLPSSPDRHGILGMRERAEAYGGSLEAAPCGNGWRVLARIPLEASRNPLGERPAEAQGEQT